MDPVGAALPELNVKRVDPVTAPEGREGDFRALGPLGQQLRFALLEVGPIRNHGGLVLRNPGADLGSVWPVMKVVPGFMFARPAHRSADDDLSLELPPVDDERSLGIGFQVAGLT